MARANVTNDSWFSSPSLAALAAFALRFSLLCWIHRDRDAHVFLFFPTSNETWNVAHALAAGYGFANPLSGMHGPTAWVAPGYPPLIAIALKLFGGDDYAAMIFGLTLNCIMSALTCLPIYALGNKVANHRVGLLSSWIWVFLPIAVLLPLEWLWDQSFSAFLVVLLIYITMEIANTTDAMKWTGYGMLWSVAALMNPAVAALFPFLLVRAIWQLRGNFKKWWQPPSFAVGIFILLMIPWGVRNHKILGKVVPIKDNFGLEFWLGNNPAVKSNLRADGHPTGNTQEMAQLVQLGEIRYMELKQMQAIEFIKTNPITFLYLSFGRFVDTWTARSDVATDRWILALHAGPEYILVTTLFSLLALAGLLLGWRGHNSNFIPLAISVLLFPAAYYVTHSSLRYRHPIDPILVILAAVPMVEAYAFLRARGFVGNPARPVSTHADSLVK